MTTPDPGGYLDTIYARTRTSVPPLPALAGELETETLVVGGGLAGLSTAIALAEAGRPVALVEAKRIGWGASGRNGGFLGAGYPLDYEELVERCGLDEAKSLRREAVAAVAWMKDLIARHAIDCGPSPAGHLCCGWYASPEGLKRHQALMNERFGASLRFVPRAELAEMVSSPRYHDGLFDPAGTQIHPLNYCLGLAQVLTRLGAKVFEATPALRIERAGAGHRVVTPEGAVKARHVVLAGGGYLGRLHPAIARGLVAVSTHIAATKPLANLRDAIRVPYCLYDDRQSGAYYRALADGRLVWGGRLTLPWERGGNTADSVRRWIGQVYPQLEPLEMEVGWSGYMSFGRSRMVQLGQLPDGVWYAFGFGGSGLGSTAVAGRLLAAAIAEGDDRHRLFARFGLGWTGGPLGRLAARVVYSSYRLQDWLKDRRARRTG